MLNVKGKLFFFNSHGKDCIILVSETREISGETYCIDNMGVHVLLRVCRPVRIEQLKDMVIEA